MFSKYKYDKTPALLAGVLFLSLLYSKAHAQQTVMQNDFEHKVNLYNVNGKPWENPELGTTGNPFFLPKWKYGRIRLADNNVFSSILLRLDLQRQEVHFMQADKVEMFLPTGSVREISLFDSIAGIPVSYNFECGYPAIDNLNENNFYMVVSSGRIKLLKSITKSIRQDKDALSGEVQKEYRQNEDYYFLPSGETKLTRYKKDKSYLLTIMKDKYTEVEAFMEKNKLSYKSAADIQKLVDYYNSLF
jgi:hypothetical protein